MYKLLDANFSRLRKNAFFWIGILISIVLGVCLPTVAKGISTTLVELTNGAISGGSLVLSESSLDYFFFTWILFIVFYMALFSSVFTGTEFGDGTMRNKIVAGHSRTEIYLSNFISSLVAGSIFCAVHMIIILVIGIPVTGGFQLFETREIVMYIICIYAIIIAFAGIFTLISMTVNHQALAVIMCICVVVVLLLIPIQQTGNLQWEQYWDEDNFVSGITYLAGTENPMYVGGIRRMFSIFMLNFLPGGPLFQWYSFSWLLYDDNLYFYPIIMLVGAAFFAIVPTVVGVKLFSKKDLK